MIGTGDSFCSTCDPCETRSEASSYLQKHKKIKCDLKLSYTRPARAVVGKLLAPEVLKFCENSRGLKSSTCLTRQGAAQTKRILSKNLGQLRADFELSSAGPARAKKTEIRPGESEVE